MNTNTDSTPGKAEAAKLAFACFVENVSQQGFMALPMEQQAAFAGKNAGLSVDELIAALRFLGRYHLSRAATLETFRAGHGHA